MLLHGLRMAYKQIRRRSRQSLQPWRSWKSSRLFPLLGLGSVTSCSTHNTSGNVKMYPFGIRMLKNWTATSAQKLHRLCTISVGRLQRSHNDWTEIAQFLYNLCTASTQLWPCLPLSACRNSRMFLYNVKTQTLQAEAPMMSEKF